MGLYDTHRKQQSGPNKSKQGGSLDLISYDNSQNRLYTCLSLAVFKQIENPLLGQRTYTLDNPPQPEVTDKNVPCQNQTTRQPDKRQHIRHMKCRTGRQTCIRYLYTRCPRYYLRPIFNNRSFTICTIRLNRNRTHLEFSASDLCR